MVMFDYAGDPSQNIIPYDQANDSFVNNTCWVGSMDPTGAAISQPAINIDNGGYSISMDNLSVENNIFVTQNYATFKFTQARYLNTATIRNNVLYNAGGTAYVNYNNTMYSFSSLNAWDSLKGGNVTADPLFEAAQTSWYNAPNNYDFRIKVGSPAIGLARAAASPVQDLLQKKRDSAPDAGAYEYGATVSSGGSTGNTGNTGGSTSNGGSSGGGSTPSTPSTDTPSTPTPASLTFVTVSLPGATVGLQYSQQFTASGGTAPYTYAVLSGAFPPGLALSAAGTISGVPTAAGTYKATVRLRDSAARTIQETFTVVVGAASSQTTTAALSSLSCGFSSLYANSAGTCTVVLSAAAPSGGRSIALSGGGLLITPATITVPAGGTSASFQAAVAWVGAAETAVLTATLSGASRTFTVKVLPAIGSSGSAALSGFTCASNRVSSNSSMSCAITLAAAAPAGGVKVAVSTSSPAVNAPAIVSVPAGVTGVSFVISAGTVSSTENVVLVASLGTSALTVALRPAGVTAILQFGPSSVSCPAGDLRSGRSLNCVITLKSAAPPGGAALLVFGSTGLLTVPSSVTVASGATQASFAVKSGQITSKVSALVCVLSAGASTCTGLVLAP
jgi:hypothetical protein